MENLQQLILVIKISHTKYIYLLRLILYFVKSNRHFSKCPPAEYYFLYTFCMDRLNNILLVHEYQVIVFSGKKYNILRWNDLQCSKSVVMESVLTTGTWSKGQNTCFPMLFFMKRPISDDRKNFYFEHWIVCGMWILETFYAFKSNCAVIVLGSVASFLVNNSIGCVAVCNLSSCKS